MKTQIFTLCISFLSFFSINAQKEFFTYEEMKELARKTEESTFLNSQLLQDLDCNDEYGFFWDAAANNWLDTFYHTRSTLNEDGGLYKIVSFRENYDMLSMLWSPASISETFYLDNPLNGAARLDSTISSIWNGNSQQYIPSEGTKIIYSGTNKPLQVINYTDLGSFGLPVGYGIFYKTVYHYNAADLRDYSLFDFINFATGNLMRSDSTVFNYDGNDYLVESLIYEYSGGNYSLSDRFVYTNNSMGLETESIYQSWENSSWINVSRYLSEYDASGNRIKYTIQSWDGTDWKTNSENTTTYDANQNIELSVFYSFDLDGQVTGGNRNTYFYNSLTGKLAEQILENWENGNFVNNRRFLYISCQSTGTQSRDKQLLDFDAYFINNGQFCLKSNSYFENAQICLISAEGRQLDLGEMDGYEASFQIPTLPKGIYWIHVKSAKGFGTQKVFKP
jgi:hypothetical protein